MRPAIAGVMHDTSGLTVRVNGHGQGELITPLLLVVVNSGLHSVTGQISHQTQFAG